VVVDRVVKIVRVDDLMVRTVEEPLAKEVDTGFTVTWKLDDWRVMVFDATGVVWYGLS